MAKGQTSAQKRHRQSEVRRVRNHAVKSAARTSVKKFLASVKANDETAAKEFFRIMTKRFDKAAKKGVIHKNAAARKKSRMARLFNKTFSK